MEGKLKSISRTTHWSLLAKAALLAASWYFLPGWAFTLLALGFYLVPLFRPAELALPFVLVMYLGLTTQSTIIGAALLGAAFYLLLGSKNLILVNRGAAYQALVYLIFFAFCLDFFAAGTQLGARNLFLGSAVLALVYFYLARGIGKHFDAYRKPEGSETLAFALASFVLWQWSWVLVFLPLNYFSQSALFFLGGATLAELISEYERGDLRRRKVLFQFSVLFIFFVLVLAANNWSV